MSQRKAIFENHERHEKNERGGAWKLFFKEESYDVMGACFEVYKEMWCGFLESVYQECLSLEFGLRKLPFQDQTRLALSYKGQSLSQVYVPDFICYERIVVEIKAVSELSDIHRAQVHNYLKATKFKLGLLINFGHHPKVQSERIVN